jgi:hypothetical protein
MNKSLIINFHTGSSFINNCAFIDQLKANNPHTQYFMLTSTQNEDTSRLINHIEGFFFLDQEDIRNSWNTPIFNHDISINLFINKIKTLLKVKWHQVINVSNNNFAAYLSSAFQAGSYIGTFIDNQHHVQYSDENFEYTNEVVIPKNIPLPLATRLAKSFGVKSSQMSFNRIEEFDRLTFEKFKKIKDAAPDKQMIGIDIISLTKSLGSNTTNSIIETLSGTHEVFIIAEQSNEAISAINHLHQETGKIYKSITCNILTFASIAKCISDFYACDGMFATVAANSGVQTYIIQTSYNARLFQSLAPNTCIVTVGDISKAALTRVDFSTQFNISMSEEFAKVCSDNLEIYHADYIESLDGRRSMSLNDIFKNRINLNLEKSYLASTVRHTLGALRSIKSDIKTTANANNFVEAIGNIFESAEGTSMASLTACIFKSRIENNTFENVSENIDYIEKQLFELKNNLKHIATYLESTLVTQSKNTTPEV